MARAGRPFDTEDRDKLRAGQRRWLRLGDDQFVKGVASGIRTSDAKEACSRGTLDRDLCEEVLRAEAEHLAAELKEPLDERVERCKLDYTHRTLFSLLGADVRVPQLSGSQFPFADLVKSGSVARAVPDPRESREDFDRFLSFIALLITADDLADDDYTDPRVEDARNQSG